MLFQIKNRYTAAKEHDCDESEQAFEKKLKKITKAKPSEKKKD